GGAGRQGAEKGGGGGARTTTPLGGRGARMAPAITAPPMAPAATPAPHPHPPPLHPHPPPLHRHWAEASVALAAKVAAMVATASNRRASSSSVSPGRAVDAANNNRPIAPATAWCCLICRKFGRPRWDLQQVSVARVSHKRVQARP